MIQPDSRPVITSLFSAVVWWGVGLGSRLERRIFDSAIFLLPEGPDAGLVQSGLFGHFGHSGLVGLFRLFAWPKVNSLSGRRVVVVQRFFRPVRPPFSQLGAASSLQVCILKLHDLIFGVR